MSRHKISTDETLLNFKELKDKYLYLRSLSSLESEKYQELETALLLATKKLITQNKEKEKRAAELIIANKELLYQNSEKEKRAAELIIANKELLYQNSEKEKRAAELIIANKELLYQNSEKEKRAAELIIANKELLYQNSEKEKRAAELIVANKELLYQNTEKEKRAVELQVALEQATESDRLKSAFLTNISHEIRTPMNGILGFASLLKEADLTGSEQQQYIQLIEESGDRLLSLIDDIFDISKIESGSMEIDLKKFNINEQIDAIESFFKSEIELKKINFKIKKALPDSQAIIYCDRSKTYAIFFNLLKNAIENSAEGAIELGYQTIGSIEKPSLQFWIKDNGIGIPLKRQEAIFERFTKSDVDNKMALQGAGLGLYIAKAFVELLKGEIWVISEENQGATFYFTIPHNTSPI
jgi:signal transduction histidine kinase